ncbi:MAG TPA: pitrilysin family protein [Candidatus Limnocylindrales bacterium]|nr:pitrilysin family protein [Candidatus Limnocylindrales bacterium]
MTIRRIAAALGAAALFLLPLRPVAAPAAPAPATATPIAQTRTLANGLRVVVLEDHAAPVVHVHTFYRFGALDETPGKTGLAHALEHMMFRGTKTLSSAGLDEMNARLGADLNAQTQNEQTHYYFVVPADRVDTILRVEADRMRNLKLDPKDWALEKGAVLQEWAQDNSNPLFSFVFGTAEKVYPGSRLGQTALGAKADIEKATVADLRRYYDAWYRPNNATLVVTGDVKAADVFAMAQRDFGAIPSHPLPARKQYTATPASGVTTSMKAEFPFTIVDEAYAAPGDAPATEHDQLRNDIAIEALSNPRGPYRAALVESGLTLGMLPIPLEDRRASVVHVLLIVAPGHTADEVRAAYEKTTADLLAKGIDPDFIAAAKRSDIAQLTYARDSIVGLGNGLGSAYVFPGDTDPAKYPAMIDAITPDEVNAVARAIYAKAAVVATLEPTTTDPTKFKPPSNISSSVTDSFGSRVPNGPIVQPAWLKTALAKPLLLHSSVDPVVTTLPNGLKLLVQRVASNPTVFVQGTVRTSGTYDPAGKEGLGAVTSGLMGWGSTKYDYAAQRKLADDRAATLSFGTSFSAHGRAEDLNTFLDALADDVRHPLFPADKLALVKQQSAAVASRRALDPNYRSRRAFLEALYPAGDPVLREDTAASINAIAMDDVKAYHAKYVRPDMTTLVVVGDVDPAAVAREVTARFGDWTAEGPKPDPHLPPIPLPTAKRQNVETAAQDVNVELGAPALARTNPDYDALVLANAIYGGGATDARLFREARDKRGLVYGAYSSLSAGRDRGTMTISFRAVPSKVDAADAVVRAEMRRMQRERVSADELARAKTRVVAAAIDAEQATSAIASDLMRIGTDDLPTSYYATLAQRYAKITPADVQRVAQRYFHPDNLVEVRTGPKS